VLCWLACFLFSSWSTTHCACYCSVKAKFHETSFPYFPHDVVNLLALSYELVDNFPMLPTHLTSWWLLHNICYGEMGIVEFGFKVFWVILKAALHCRSKRLIFFIKTCLLVTFMCDILVLYKWKLFGSVTFLSVQGETFHRALSIWEPETVLCANFCSSFWAHCSWPSSPFPNPNIMYVLCKICQEAFTVPVNRNIGNSIVECFGLDWRFFPVYWQYGFKELMEHWSRYASTMLYTCQREISASRPS